MLTHDELLEQVNNYISSECDCESCKFINGPYVALRAIVELHKPVKVNHNYYATEYGCSSDICQDKYDEPMEYPCQTIRTIEKELT